MPETIESGRRWSGYVCPDCRFVFRVPKDHGGLGVVCPGCRRMLRIPMPGDRVPPLVVPIRSLANDAEAEAKTAPAGNKGRRRRKSRQGKGHDWDRESAGPSGHRLGDKRQMFWMMVGGGTLFLLIVAWVVVAMLGGKTTHAEPQAGEASGPEVVVADSSGAPAPPVAVKSDAAILAEAEPLVRAFLEATRVEDLLPLVRRPEVVESRMRGHYRDGAIEAPGIGSFNQSFQLSRLGPVISVSVRTRDYEDRVVSMVDTPQGLKIDWESWVGWSDMPWADFIADKPATAKVFRVKLSPVDYYNFSFSDDSRWRSYRLESPDGEHAIFGYSERGTVLDSTLRPAPDVKQVPLTLLLRFPGDAASGNQVLIDRLIAEGWVEQTEETQ